MNNFTYRIMFGYTAFTGPLYKLYATWNENEGIVNFEIESCHPDYVNKGVLDSDKSKEFINYFFDFIENRDDANCDTLKELEYYHDVPTYQLVTSQGLHEYELDRWQNGTEQFDVTPLYKMIVICDNKANFLKDEE